MKTDGLQNVRGEPVMVPHWVRGEESATLDQPACSALHMIGLGRSVGTPKAGNHSTSDGGESFDELTRRAAEAKGKIVLFDVPFTQLRTRLCDIAAVQRAPRRRLVRLPR